MSSSGLEVSQLLSWLEIKARGKIIPKPLEIGQGAMLAVSFADFNSHSHFACEPAATSGNLARKGGGAE
jgi:hypothetical protein